MEAQAEVSDEPLIEAYRKQRGSVRGGEPDGETLIQAYRDGQVQLARHVATSNLLRLKCDQLRARLLREQSRRLRGNIATAIMLTAVQSNGDESVTAEVET